MDEYPKIITILLSAANLTFWCIVDGTAPVSCNQGLPSNRLKVAGMSITWNFTSLLIFSTSNRRVTLPTTLLLELSYPLAPWLDERTSEALIPSLLKVLQGHTFKADPLSSNTYGIHLVRHFREMYRGLLCPRLSRGISLLVKAIVGFGALDAIIRPTRALGVISMGTLVFPKV